MNITPCSRVRSCLLPIFIAMLLFFYPSMLLAADKHLPKEKRGVFTISKKIRGPLLVGEGGERVMKENDRRIKIIASGKPYYVIKETVVYLGKKKINMNKLPVPCKATIDYQPIRRNEGNLLKIQVTKVLPGASAAWPKGHPE